MGAVIAYRSRDRLGCYAASDMRVLRRNSDPCAISRGMPLPKLYLNCASNNDVLSVRRASMLDDLLVREYKPKRLQIKPPGAMPGEFDHPVST